MITPRTPITVSAIDLNIRLTRVSFPDHAQTNTMATSIIDPTTLFLNRISLSFCPCYGPERIKIFNFWTYFESFKPTPIQRRIKSPNLNDMFYQNYGACLNGKQMYKYCENLARYCEEILKQFGKIISLPGASA